MNLIKEYYKKFKTFIENNNLIQENDKIVIAVSGGYDSVALLLFFYYLTKEKNIKILTAHLNHNIRKGDAEKDMAFVKELSEILNIEFAGETLDIPELRKSVKGKSPEEFAREKRYEFLQKVCKQRNFTRIATAHHLDDNVETFFLNMLTGTGLNGLTGIPVKIKNIIRPLLQFRKKELVEFVEACGFTARTDLTNFDNNIPRNWIRNTLFPVIEKQFKSFKNKINTLIDIIENENEFIQNYVNEILKNILYSYGISIRKDLFLSQSVAVKRRVVYFILKKLNINNIDYRMINEILNIMELERDTYRYNDIIIWNYNDMLYFTLDSENSFSYNITSQNEIEINPLGYKVRKKIVNKKVDNYKKSCIYINDKEIKKIVIRSRKEGDTIKLMNTDYRKSLKKLFIDLKIPKILRNLVPVVEVNNEVAGIFLNFKPINMLNRISEEYKISSNSDKTIILEFEEV